MKRIFVNPVNKDDKVETSEIETEDNSRLEITKTYDNALNQFLKPGEEHHPRQIAENAVELKKTKGSSDNSDDDQDNIRDSDYIPH